MKKILALLFICLGFAWGTALGQNIVAPDTVCASLGGTNTRWATVSLNADNLARTQWTITIGSATGPVAVEGVDYNVLYGEVGTLSNGGGQNASGANRSLSIELLKPGTYIFRARGERSNGNQVANLTRRIVVVSCPMDICRGQNTSMAGFTEDFGTTTTRIQLDPNRGTIQYTFQGTGSLNDDYYSIYNQLELRPEWDTSRDHTGNTNGAMLVANSAYLPMIFYSRRVNGLCAGATYNFSAWFRNADGRDVIEGACAGGMIYAGVTFRILDANTGVVLDSFNTYDVSAPLHRNPINRGWQQYGGSFKTPPGVSDVIVQIRNNNPGGCGNDIAIDDISFSYCAPYIYSFFDGQMDQLGGEYTMCAGAATTLTSVYTPSDYFDDPQYYWQYSDDSTNWTTIVGNGDGLSGYDSSVLVFEQDAALLLGNDSVITERFFRLMIYEGGNDYTTCAQPSVPIKVTLLPNPRISVTGAQICIGSSATLTACCRYDTYTWNDPDNTENESITVSPTVTTEYTVIGRKDYGNGRTCYREASAPVIVDTMPVLNLNLTGPNPICIGQSVDLSIDGSNIIYDIVWEPTGDITTDIHDTPGTPGTHEYKVTVLNGACEAKDSIDIVVRDEPDVTLGTIPASCSSTGSFTIPFSNPVNDPQTYDIIAAGANPMPGFTTVTNQALSGTSITVAYPVGVAPGTYTFNLVLKNPALSCERTKPFSVTIAAPSTPPTGIAASTTQICVNGAVTLTVQGGNLAAGAQWVWYAGGCGSGTPLGTGNTITVNISATTTFYVRAENTGSPCPATTCASVTVNVYPMPGNVDAGPDQQHCEDSIFIMVANQPSANTAKAVWSVISASVPVSQIIIEDVTRENTRVIVPKGATATLNWGTPDGVCPGKDDQITLTNYINPANLANAGPDQKLCNVTSFTLDAATISSVPTANGTWSVVHTSGATPSISSLTDPKATVTVAVGDSVVLRWTVTNGICPAASDDVTLVSYRQPTTAVAGPDQRRCNVTSFTLAGNTPTVGTGRWTVVYGPNANITNPASPTSTVTVNAGDSVVLRWTISNGTCTASSDNVTLVSYRQPTTAAAGPDQRLCNVTSFTLAANTPSAGTGRWTVVYGPNANIANPASPTSTVTVNAGDSVVLRWTVSNGVCTPSSDEVTLVSYRQPTTAAAGPDQRLCNVTSFTLAGNTPTVGTGRWTVVYGPNANITNPASPTSTVTVNAGDSVVLRWTISNGACTASSDNVTLVSYRQPTTAAAGPDQRLCNVTSFTLAGNTPTVGTGRWTVVYGPNANITNPASPTSTVTANAGDSVVLRWTISNGACAASSDEVTLVSYRQPTTAAAGPDQRLCNVTSFTLNANAPSVATATGTWTRVHGNPAISNINDPNAIVTVAVGDSVVLRWTITNGPCAATSDNITLVSYRLPTTAAAGPDQRLCNVTSFTLAGNTPTVGTGRWTVVYGPNANITNPASPTSAVTVNAGDSVVLRWTVTNGTCAASTDEVTLVSYRQPSAAAAGPDREQCNNATFTLAATAPVVGTGTWTVVSPASGVTIANIHNPASTVQVPAGVTATLRWTVTNGPCTASTDEVVLSNLNVIAGNTISADQTICANEAAAPVGGGTITGGNGTYTYQWQSSTTSGTTGFTNIPGATAATYAPGMISQDSIWFRRVVTSGPCASSISNAVKIYVITRPPVVVFVPAPMTVNCRLGMDYTTLFGTPQFSHTPYMNEPLTITFSDASTISGCTRTFTRTWTATDRCGLTTTASQTITVVDTEAPLFTSAKPADITVNCDAIPAAVNLNAYDSCSGAIVVTPVETRQNIPGACAGNYRIIRTWTATDGCNNSATLTQTITVQDTTRPVFTIAPPRDTTVNCNAIPAAPALTATDNCTPGTITVTATDTRQNIPGSQCADNYRIIRTWVARDQCGNAATVQQTITVQDTTRPVFSIPQPADVTVECDNVPAWPAVTATDNCSSNVQVVTSEQRTDLLPNCGNNYRLIRTWRATDNCGNTASMQQIITVQDTTGPVFTMLPPADTTVNCDQIPPPANNVAATDNCAGNVTISRSQVRETIPGACSSNYRLIRSWTATDACGNTSVVRQVITVQDTTGPVIAPAPADLVLNCGDAIPAAPRLTATDNCDPGFPRRVTAVEDPYTKDICAGYTIIRRWRITDGCGNQSVERVQRITVNPCPKPELDPVLPVNCSDNPVFTLQLQNNVSNPVYTLVSVTPANAVQVPLSQQSNMFNLNGATQASFIVRDGITGCVSDTVTYDLQYSTKPMVDLGRDTTICGGNSLILDAGAANFNYTIRWSTGETTQRINVSTAGTYWVTVTNGVCVTTDTIRVDVIPMPLVNLPDASICRGQSVKLDAFVDGATYLWSTGATTSSILVSTQEEFWVRVTKSGCITIDTVNVTVNPPPDISLNRDTAICPDQSIMLTVNVLNGGDVRWATGATSPSIVVNEPGLYWVTVTRDNCMIRDTVNVRLQPGINVELGPNREICPGGRITIDGTTQDAISYLWDDGDPNPVKEVDATGKYRLAVMDRFCQRVYMDSVKVWVTSTPYIELGNDTTMCIGETLRLRADGSHITSVLWSDGSTGPFLDVTRAGTYSVTVFNDCGSYTDQITVDYMQCDPKPTFPNAFSPNGDGRNDYFRPVVKGPMYEYELRIFNRWGELIYLGRDSKKGWDGRYHGEPVGVGTYVWWLTYKKMPGGNPNVIKGEVTVIR